MTIEKAIWRLETCLMCDDCSTCYTKYCTATAGNTDDLLKRRSEGHEEA